jgi:hypothetical protein
VRIWLSTTPKEQTVWCAEVQFSDYGRVTDAHESYVERQHYLLVLNAVDIENRVFCRIGMAEFDRSLDKTDWNAFTKTHEVRDDPWEGLELTVLSLI